MARKQPRPKTEPVTRALVGEPFLIGHPGPLREAGVYQIGGFGPRIVYTSRTGTGALTAPKTKSCVHSRPLLPAPKSFHGVAAGDREGYAQICRLCEYETERRTP